MILLVSHVSTYRYDAPVRGAVQSLRMTPSVCDGQRAIRWQVEVPGGTRGAAFRDGAGDWIESWSLRGPASEITVKVTGEVATTDSRPACCAASAKPSRPRSICAKPRRPAPTAG